VVSGTKMGQQICAAGWGLNFTSIWEVWTLARCRYHFCSVFWHIVLQGEGCSMFSLINESKFHRCLKSFLICRERKDTDCPEINIRHFGNSLHVNSHSELNYNLQTLRCGSLIMQRIIPGELLLIAFPQSKHQVCVGTLLKSGHLPLVEPKQHLQTEADKICPLPVYSVKLTNFSRNALLLLLLLFHIY